MAQNNRPYVLWRRVSTKQQDNSGLGLEAQVAIGEYYMQTPAQKIFTDVYTGTKLAECRQLWAAIRYCKANGLLLVIANTDRFRNVEGAMQALDAMGEGNIIFCDLPTTDRTVLTIVFAIWERQAMQGRIKTQVALNELKKKEQRGEKWISKKGNLCGRLGRPADGIDEHGRPYWDLSAANEASCIAKQEAAIRWREQSAAYKMVREWQAMGKTRNEMLAELQRLYEHAPEKFGTPKGQCVTRSVLDRWCREMNPLAV